MDTKLEAELIRKYPRIFKLAQEANFKDWDKSHGRWPFSLFGIECDNGWYDLLDRLCEKVEACINRAEDPDIYYVVQIKEKFGGLRFYMSSHTVEFHCLIREAEKESEITCEICGRPGILGENKWNWYQTLCQECRTKKDAELDKEF